MTEDSVDERAEPPEERAELAEDRAELPDAVASLVTVEGSPDTVVVRSIVMGKTTICVLPSSVWVIVVCTTRVNSVVAVVVVVWVWVSVARLDAADFAASMAVSGSGAPTRLQPASNGDKRRSTPMSMQELCTQVTTSGRKLPEERPARQRQGRSLTLQFEY